MTPDHGVVAGIDEAGLGPILGPLAMGWTAFRAPHGACLWERLAAAVGREPADDATRLVVADSKLVFTRNPRGARRLERTVLAFLEQLGGAPRSARELVLSAPRALRAADADYERAPWYDRLAEHLPAAQERAVVEDAAAALRVACAAADVELLSAGVAAHPAGTLNDSYRRTNNKARTLWEKTAPILQHLWTELAPRGLHVTVDRQGGRLHYAALLLATFPLAEFACLREGREGSEYRLSARDEGGVRRTMTVLFVEKADRASFPVALASCLAKYAREQCMDAFNRYFGELEPALRPTAGYTTDGRRWIRDADGVLARAAIDPGVLIRER